MMLAGAEGETWEERIHATIMRQWHGAYSLVILTRGVSPYAIRGRPPPEGRLKRRPRRRVGVRALRTIGCEAIRGVDPGEVIRLYDRRPFRPEGPPAARLARCHLQAHLFLAAG